jgi:tagatose-1,6-bisphosphate aldolase
VAGIHVMAYRQEEYVAEIVDESGVLQGRQPWKREVRADDQLVADRLGHLLHDNVTETQSEMVKTAH